MPSIDADPAVIQERIYFEALETSRVKIQCNFARCGAVFFEGDDWDGVDEDVSGAWLVEAITHIYTKHGGSL